MSLSELKRFVALVCTVFSASVGAGSIKCVEQENNAVIVKMEMPHPKEALIYRPGGETVWLQIEGALAHQQIEDFEYLREWSINSSTVGTVYKEGKPYVEPIINSKGIYHLYIANNIETEPENTYFIECYFEIT